MRKNLLITFIAAACFVNAKQDPSQLQERVEQSTEKKVSGEYGAKNPVDRVCASNYGFYVTADFLWWRAENQGFTYAMSLPNSLFNHAAKYLRLDPNWDPGFRLGTGWNSHYDHWDLGLVWTWYYNHAKEEHNQNVPTGSAGGFYPLFPVAALMDGEGGNSYRIAKAHYRLTHNAIDLELGRSHFMTRALSFRPHWGIRGAWLYQKFNDRFLNPPTLPMGITSQSLKLEAHNDYWGVGPRAGSGATWHLGKGFSIEGQIAAALLYGNTDTKFKSEIFATPTSTGYVVDQYYRDSFSQLVPTLQMALGLEWGMCSKCERYFYSVSALWETNYWWNQFNVPVAFSNTLLTAPLPNVGNQAVSMEGLTVNARLDF